MSLSILGLKLIHVSKKGYRSTMRLILTSSAIHGCKMAHKTIKTQRNFGWNMNNFAVDDVSLRSSTVKTKFASHFRDHFVNAHIQWDITLQCNIVSHWLWAFTNDPCSYMYWTGGLSLLCSCLITVMLLRSSTVNNWLLQFECVLIIKNRFDDVCSYLRRVLDVVAGDDITVVRTDAGLKYFGEIGWEAFRTPQTVGRFVFARDAMAEKYYPAQSTHGSVKLGCMASRQERCEDASSEERHPWG